MTEKELLQYAALTLAGLATIYLLLPAGQSQPGLAVGLQNLSNHCFVNSVLQSLVRIPSLRAFLEESCRRGRNARVTKALKSTLSQLSETPLHRKSISAGNFIAVLESLYGRTLSVRQEDAHEFFQLIAENIETEHTSTDLKAPFLGSTTSHVQCSSCGYRSNPVRTTFNVLSLPIPQKWSCHLDDCIQEYISDKPIEGYDCRRCRLLGAAKDFPKHRAPIEEALSNSDTQLPENIEGITLPRSLRTVIQKTQIVALPKILVLHLNRSIFDAYASKNSCSVQMDEMLEVQSQKYKLQSIITHRGRHDSGHYECFRCHPQKGRGRFIRISDESIALTNIDGVREQSQGVYMLYYERTM